MEKAKRLWAKPSKEWKIAVMTLIVGGLAVPILIASSGRGQAEEASLRSWAADANAVCRKARHDQERNLGARRRASGDEQRAELFLQLLYQLADRVDQLDTIATPSKRGEDIIELIRLARQSLQEQRQALDLPWKRAKPLFDVADKHGREATQLARDLGASRCDFEEVGAPADPLVPNQRGDV